MVGTAISGFLSNSGLTHGRSHFLVKNAMLVLNFITAVDFSWMQQCQVCLLSLAGATIRSRLALHKWRQVCLPGILGETSRKPHSFPCTFNFSIFN